MVGTYPHADFPPPWTIEEHSESFIVKDATGQALGYFNFNDEPQKDWPQMIGRFASTQADGNSSDKLGC